MTKDEFRRVRQTAGHTQTSIARAMGVHLRTVARWELGEIVIPKVAELALRYVAEHAENSERMDFDLRAARGGLLEVQKKGTVSAKIEKELRPKRGSKQAVKKRG